MQKTVREVARLCPELRYRNSVLDRCQPAFWPFEFVIRSTINSRRSNTARALKKKQKLAAATPAVAGPMVSHKKAKTSTDEQQTTPALEENLVVPSDSGNSSPALIPKAGAANETSEEQLCSNDNLTEEPCPFSIEDSNFGTIAPTAPDDQLPLETVANLYPEVSSAEDTAFAMSLLEEPDPVEVPVAEDAKNSVFTLFMPEQSRVKHGMWDSHANAVAKCHVLGPAAKIYNHKAPEGYRVVSLIRLSQRPGMSRVQVPAIEKYQGGNTEEINQGGLQGRFESGARLFLWPIDMIYRTRKDGSLNADGLISWVVSPVTSSNLPRDTRAATSSRKRRA